MKNTLLGLTIMLGGVFVNAQTYNSVAEYRSPQPTNLDYLGRAQSILQERYNRNTQRVSDAVDNISSQISQYENANVIANRINRNCINELSVNYTNDNSVTNAIRWLYRCANEQISR